MSEVAVEVEGRRLVISNLDKVLYPRTGTTKGEVLNYYAQISPVLLPHLADRCVTRIRWPHGVGDKSFFEKNVPNRTPSWVRTVEVPTTGSRGSGSSGVLRFPVVEDLATLTWLANLAALELHVHQWRVGADDEILEPDRLVIDLDPGEPAGLHECAQVALMVREALAERDLEAVPVTSGSKGLHLYAALPGATGSADDDGEAGDEVRSSRIAREVAEMLQAAHPKLVTATMTKSRRGGKVFLDWSQNSPSKTTVSPYSLRGRERPTVATPLTWDEVTEASEDPLAIDQFDFEEVLARVEQHGDLFVLD